MIWCPRTIKSRSCCFTKSRTIFSEKTWLVPLSLGPHPFNYPPRIIAAGPVAGSDHNKSQNNPLSGIGDGLLRFAIYFKFFSYGDKPPCIQSILSSIRAVTGKWLNNFMKSLHNFILYLRLHSSKKPYIFEMFWHSWLPRSRKTHSGYLTFKARRKQIVSIDCIPLST